MQYYVAATNCYEIVIPGKLGTITHYKDVDRLKLCIELWVYVLWLASLTKSSSLVIGSGNYMNVALCDRCETDSLVLRVIHFNGSVWAT